MLEVLEARECDNEASTHGLNTLEIPFPGLMTFLFFFLNFGPKDVYRQSFIIIIYYLFIIYLFITYLLCIYYLFIIYVLFIYYLLIYYLFIYLLFI